MTHNKDKGTSVGFTNLEKAISEMPKEQFDHVENQMKKLNKKGTSVGFSKPFQERINYVVSEGYYIGSSVNMPLLVQAKSYEEMQKGIRELGRHYLGNLVKQFMQDEPFEFVQVETFHKTN